MSTTKRFACSLCGLKFSQEKFMVNHLKFCKEIEDPNDRLGADRVEVGSKDCGKRIPKPKTLERKHSKIGLKKKSTSPESFVFVDCDINLDSELDSTLEENPVTSVVFNDFSDIKIEKSSDDVDARKSNIVIKTERDIELGDTVVQNECNDITVGKVVIPSQPNVAFDKAHTSHSEQLMKYLNTNTSVRSADYALRVMTHTGKKLYKCSKCKFTNQCLQSVKIHMETQIHRRGNHRREEIPQATSMPRRKYIITKLRTTFM